MCLVLIAVLTSEVAHTAHKTNSKQRMLVASVGDPLAAVAKTAEAGSGCWKTPTWRNRTALTAACPVGDTHTWVLLEPWTWCSSQDYEAHIILRLSLSFSLSISPRSLPTLNLHLFTFLQGAWLSNKFARSSRMWVLLLLCCCLQLLPLAATVLSNTLFLCHLYYLLCHSLFSASTLNWLKLELYSFPVNSI